MNKVYMLAYLNEALSSAPFEEGNIPKCFTDRVMTEKENAIGNLTDHPEILRLFALRDKLKEESKKTIEVNQPDEAEMQDMEEPPEWFREVVRKQDFAKAIGELAWVMVRNIYSTRSPVIGIRANWQVVAKEEDEVEVPTGPFTGGGVMHVMLIGH